MRVLSSCFLLAMLAVFATGCSGPAPDPLSRPLPSGPSLSETADALPPSDVPAVAARPLEDPAPAESSADEGEEVPRLAESLPEEKKAAGGVFGFLRKRIETSVKNRVRPNETELGAMDVMEGMLARDKLGGEDGIFNQRDIDAVTDSLLEDPAVIAQIRSGIKTEARNRASQGWFQPVKRWVADAATSPGNPISWWAWDDIWEEGKQTARGQIRQQMEDGFDAEGITAQPGLGPDRVVRSGITQAGMDRFQGAADTVKSYGDRVKSTIGALAPEYDFPHGIGQADVQAIREMETPPNGVKR